MEVETIGPHLVMKVRYPNCTRCAFEGNKVLVFLRVRPADALKWSRIDPHFRAEPGGLRVNLRHAPSPAARFPPTDDGWKDAIAYAKSKPQ